MKKLIFSVLVVCFLFVGCINETIILTDTVTEIEMSKDFWNGYHYLVTFEGGITVFINNNTSGDLPKIGNKFQVVKVADWFNSHKELRIVE